MPQSFALIIVHLVFSTKDRTAILNTSIRADLHAYLATVARNAGCECFRVGGVADHVHLAISLSRITTSAKMVEERKTSSSKWLKTRSSALAAFAWQRGYAAFAVGPSDLGALTHYIDTQEERHHKQTFEDELRALLTKYGIEHNELYMWD